MFLRGKKADEDTAWQAGEAALDGAKPMKDNGYKVDLAKSLIQRALLASVYDWHRPTFAGAPIDRGERPVRKADTAFSFHTSGPVEAKKILDYGHLPVLISSRF